MVEYRIYNSNGEYLGEPRAAGRGRPPYYPFRDLQPGQYVKVPRSEERRLIRSVRNARQQGIYLEVIQGPCLDWFVRRVAFPGTKP
jgi:hypothetical protein